MKKINIRELAKELSENENLIVRYNELKNGFDLSVRIDEEVLKDNITNELYELDFSIYDIIILEDYDGSIYQESINTITMAYCELEKTISTNKFDIKLSSADMKIFDWSGHCPNMVVKEVWHKIDSETIKRIYSNSRLVGCIIDNNCVNNCVKISDEVVGECNPLEDEMKEYHNECLDCAEAFRWGVPCPHMRGECSFKRRGK